MKTQATLVTNPKIKSEVLLSSLLIGASCLAGSFYFESPALMVVGLCFPVVLPFMVRDPGEWQGQCPACGQTQRHRNNAMVTNFHCVKCKALIEVDSKGQWSQIP